jgi:dienelactone hydrolase
VFAKEPMLWVHGEEDNYVPLSACRDYAQRIAATGTPVEFVVIPSAMHKFDADDLRRRHLRDVQRNVASCPLELDIDSLLHHDHTTGRSLTGDEFRRARQACSTTGADIEGNREARDRAGQAIVVFLRRIFAP